MSEIQPAVRYRFGVFEADTSSGELRRQGIRVKLNAQPFQVLCLLLERPGEVLTREDICRVLWPDGTFVDYEHGVNSAMNRIREALGDKANNPRFVETMARRGYRFIAPVERIGESRQEATKQDDPAGAEEDLPGSLPKTSPSFLATEEELPETSPTTVRMLFILLQVMYLCFYVSALANLSEIEGLIHLLPYADATYVVLVISASLLIPVRVFLACMVLFKAPRAREKFLSMWPFLLLLDVLWALAPFLLLHHINFGLALACTAILVYAPFAQRSLILMGAASRD